MKKTADQLKKGEKLSIGGEKILIESLEISDIGKQGVRKCRIVARKNNGESIVIIRPSNYPFDII
jgi:translation elongation factor P/translation initiation factor 5A